MNVQTLVGINYESPYSVVKITTDGTPKTELIDRIRSFHDVFLYDYKVEGNTISIYTHLPQLWRETADAFNRLSTGEATEEETKDYILGKVIRSQIYSMSSIPILQKAHEMGLETNIAFVHNGLDISTYGYPGQWNRYYRIGVGKNSGISVAAASTGDSSIAKIIQRDKVKSNQLVDSLNLPMAKWEVIEDEKNLKEVFSNYTTPVVIKPVGLTQGSGVTTNINDIDHALRAFKYAKEIIDGKPRQAWQTKVLIQRQVPGDDYRILVIDGTMEIATKRIPAFVVGDGEKSIKELIEETNTDPRRDMENPAHVLKPIQFDQPLDEYLKEQNLSLDTIPVKDEQVFVRKVASMSQGGMTEDFTEKVHPQIKFLVESIASTVHANVVGVDVICEDISKPLTNDNGSFIEMNTMPEAYLNAFPTTGTQYPDIGEKMIAGFIKAEEPVKKIVVVGATDGQLLNYLKTHDYINQFTRTGTLTDGKIYINDEFMNEVEDFWTGVKALKLNASLDTIVIHHKDLDHLRENGSGFDRIDTMLSENPIEEFHKYQAEGYITGLIHWK